MKNLSENFDYLAMSFPLLKEFRYGSCCEKARLKSLSIAISDVYTHLDIKESNLSIKNNPKKYYDGLIKIILNDNNLENSEKLKLVALL